MKFCIPAISFLILATGSPAWTQSISIRATGTQFEQLAETALAQNKDLQAAREQLRQAEARLLQAGLRPNPSLDVARSTDAPFANEGDGGFAVTFSQPIELGGKRIKRMAVGQASIELAKAQIADAERQIAGHLRSLYLEAIDALRRRDLLDKTIQLSGQMAATMNVRLHAGDASELEVHLLAAETSRLDSQRLDIEGRIDELRLQLNSLAGLPLDGSLELQNPAMENMSDLDEENWIAKALATRPDLIASRLEEALAAARLTLSQSQKKPDITASLRFARESVLNLSSALTPGRSFGRESVLEFGVSIPLPFSNREQGNIAVAVSEVAEARLRRESRERVVRSEVTAALRKYLSSRHRLDVIRSGVVKENEQSYQIIKLAYDLGNARFTEVINQQRLVVEADLSELAVESELAADAAELDLAIGGRVAQN